MIKRISTRAMSVFICTGFVIMLAMGAANAQTIHAILVGNTIDPNIGQGDKLDLDLMRNLLQDASKHTGMQLKMKVFDSKIPRAQIMDAVKNLNPNKADTVVFFYTGHGYRMSSFKAKWPAMCLDGTYGGSAGLDLKWAYDTLKQKGPRLLIVMADCCNSYLPEGSIDTHLSVAYTEGNPEAYKKLFAEAKGGILAASSMPGQYSYSGDTGSQYTVQFMSSIKSALSSSNPNWKGVMDKAVQPIMGGKQVPLYAMDSTINPDGKITPPYKDDNLFKEDKQQPGSASFGNLLIAMESHIPYAAQTPQWTGMRANWINRVLKAENDIAKMKTEVLLFEKHILWNAQKEEWKSERPGWMDKVKSAGSVAQLANPLLEVEQSIKDGTFITLWDKERPGWLQKVQSLGGGGGGGSDNKDYVNPNPVTGSIGKLIVELEESVLSSAKLSEWQSQRASWKNDVLGAGTDIQKLSQLLIDFESNVDYNAQIPDWSSKRPDWLSKTESAQSISDLKQSLLDCEVSITLDNQIQTWSQRRNGWIQEVQNLQ